MEYIAFPENLLFYLFGVPITISHPVPPNQNL